MKPPDPTWAPVFASGVVAFGAFLGIWFSQRTTAQREREAREREAKEKRADRWDDFRMKTLINLQDTLHQMVLLPSRLATCEPGEDLRFRLTGEMERARFQASVLCARVRDEPLGVLVLELGGLCYQGINHSMSSPALNDPSRPNPGMAISVKFEEVNDRIGELLATLRPDHP